MTTGPKSTGRQAVEAIWRMDSARIVGALARYTGDFALAEDLAQEALAQALVSWPIDGTPENPTGWLLTAGRRRAVDTFRRRSTLDDRYATLGRDLAEGGLAAGTLAPKGQQDVADLADPDRIDDDVLALFFTACHPVVGQEAQIALTLRVVCGLSSDDIARAFLIPAATVQARITRAKKTLAAAKVPFEVPPAADRPARLTAVLQVVYLLFTAGSTAPTGTELLRVDLAAEAIRLARILRAFVPDVSETHALVALLELTAARFPARVGPTGLPVLLADQDRRLWDRAAIRRGSAALAQAGRTGRGLGWYGIQAAIAECHAVATDVDGTDWDRIVVLYGILDRLAPSPVVRLNRAVALSMAEGAAAGLAVVDTLADDPLLARGHLLPSVRGELLARLGRTAEAVAAYDTAIDRCGNEAERALLRTKRGALGPPESSG